MREIIVRESIASPRSALIPVFTATNASNGAEINNTKEVAQTETSVDAENISKYSICLATSNEVECLSVDEVAKENRVAKQMEQTLGKRTQPYSGSSDLSQKPQPQPPVKQLIKHFNETPNNDSDVSSLTDSTKIVEFGQGLSRAFGFARSTAFDQSSAGGPKRSEKSKCAAVPPSLPPPPPNPQQHLRPAVAAPMRPDFVVPVSPPPCVSQTGLSPPLSLLARITRNGGSKKSIPVTSPSARANGKSATPCVKEMSPVGGLRSTGPRRVVPLATAKKDIAESFPPFVPRIVNGFNFRQPSGSEAAILLTGDEIEILSENQETPNRGGEEDTSPNKQNIDLEFKRKYGLDESEDSEDEFEENFFRQKRSKSFATDDENQQSNSTRPTPDPEQIRDAYCFPEETTEFSTKECSLKNICGNHDGSSAELTLKPKPLATVTRTFFGIILVAIIVPFLFALASWNQAIGMNIEYCRPEQVPQWIPRTVGSKHGLAKDFWGQYLPGCIKCPTGAVCEGSNVISCENPDFEVFGDEGFGPLSVFFGLSPICLHKNIDVQFVKTQPHFNPRVRGRALPFSTRIGILWAEFCVLVQERWADATRWWRDSSALVAADVDSGL
ncbi:hypothetical protein HDU84_006720 [Entophlyctis sp. JEL0112]|nr:hypothetical protein HDU84_006720 [Entophlyctis sp. JEL0112]